MKKQEHPLFCWPGCLLWLLPLAVAVFLFFRSGEVDTLWWYLTVSPLVALTLIPLFSSTWFGITILILLFLYCSIGSSGAPVSYAIWEPAAWVNIREMRGLEMTEFEWFHWWPFKWLIAILCLNMAIVTIRKIKFTILTLGVWTIHTGVIVTVLGCLVYFSQKTEGDVLVSRRVVEIQVQGEEPVTMVVTPSNTVSIGETTYTISSINPSWELMSGEDSGTIAYAVTVSVQGPEKSFMRQLIAGYPQYTEDIVQSNDPNQPMARAKNVLGRALVDESLKMSLQYDEQHVFYVTQSGAVYLRELALDGTPVTPWIERPIKNLPRYNDYITAREDAWETPVSPHTTPLDPLAIAVLPSDQDDPIADAITVSGYLRYAYMDQKMKGGGDALFPVAWVTLRKGNEAQQTAELYAFAPGSSTADTSLMTFRWVDNNVALEELENRIMPSLQAEIDGTTYRLPVAPSEEFMQLGDTEYSYKIDSVQNNLTIAGRVVSLAIITLQRGEKSWERWVFDNPAMTRDVTQDAQHEDSSVQIFDENITTVYQPGGVPITIIGGLEDGSYSLLTSIVGDEPTNEPLILGVPIALTDDITLTLNRVEPNAFTEVGPIIVPKFQQDPSASNMYSMVRVTLPETDGGASVWLPYHHYAFESIEEAARRFRYNPTTLRLPSGKSIEFMFSRERAALPKPVVLERFEVDSHLGGFTGSTSSILNWRSIIRFLDGGESTLAVSVNDPRSYGEYWFFQSQWDPPDGRSQGLNYTVLGVGNRHGVLQMLLGCCLTVAGMIWAFYVKPMIKRKRQQAVYAGVSS
ncbi:MAG: hypothetical protein H8E86_01595 [Planctomycetes bacterium]|nr:hypothetical protein [Planctomycetota bacterium]